MRKKVISYKSLPPTLPLNLTLIVYLVLDKFQVSDWVWGVSATLMTLLWVGAIYNILTSKYVDILK